MTSEAVTIEVLLFIATMPPFVVLVAAGAIAGVLGGLLRLSLQKKLWRPKGLGLYSCPHLGGYFLQPQ
jgi:hypothetical protein